MEKRILTSGFGKCLLGLAALAAALGLSTGVTRADMTGYTTSGTETDLGGYGLAAFEFTPTKNINVTELGFTAISLGGADAPHVTLWHDTSGLGSLAFVYDTGDILGDITFPTPNPNTSPIAPTYVSVGMPISLTAGQTYVVTAPAYWAPTYDAVDVGVNPVLGSPVFLGTGPNNWMGWPNSGYDFANLLPDLATNIVTTPNLQFTVVPEPASLGLLGIGAVGLLARRKRA